MLFGKVKSFLATSAQVAVFVAVSLVSIFLFKRSVKAKAETDVKQELQLEDMQNAIRIKNETQDALRKEQVLLDDAGHLFLVDELHKAGKLRD